MRCTTLSVSQINEAMPGSTGTPTSRGSDNSVRRRLCLDRLCLRRLTHAQSNHEQAYQDAQAHYRCKDALQDLHTAEKADQKADQPNVHAPEEYILSPGPQGSPFLGRIVQQRSEERRVGKEC